MKVKLFLVFLLLFSINTFSQDKKEFKFENGTTAFWVKGDKGWGVEDKYGKTIVPQLYGDLYCYGNLIYCVKKYGDISPCELYNSLGKCKIKESDGYSHLEFTKSKDQWVVTSNHPLAAFDENGDIKYKYKILKDAAGFNYIVNELTDTVVVEPGIYRGLLSFTIAGDAIRTYIGDKEGIVNLDGTMVIPAHTYTNIIPHNGGFNVRKSSSNGFVGYFNREGFCVIPDDKYTNIFKQEDGRFIVTYDGGSAILDSLGNTIFETKYQDLSLKKDTEGNFYYMTHLGNGKGKITYNGKLIEEVNPTITKREIKNKYIKYIEVINEKGLVGAVDTLGATIIPCSYDRIYYDDFYASKIRGFHLYKNGTVGFADNTGKIIIPCGIYHRISSLQGDGEYFIVECRGRKGVCTKNGEPIINPIYDDFNIANGIFYANVGIMEGVINQKGEIIVPFKYTNVRYDKKTGNYDVELFDKEGICNSLGQIIIPPLYTSVIHSSYSAGPFGSIYRVEDGKTEGIYSADGKMIFPTGIFENVSITNLNINLPFNEEWFIKAYNNHKEAVCYYDLRGNLLHDTRKDILFDKYFNYGDTEFDKKNYQKAIEHYKQAITIKQDGTAYYNIGAALYNLGRHKDAIKNLQKSVELSNSQRICDMANDLIIECKLCIQQKIERRTNLWLGILGTALDVALTITQSNDAISNYNLGIITPYPSGTMSPSSSLDYLIDPRYAATQVQQEQWDKYLQNTNGGATMTYNEWTNFNLMMTTPMATPTIDTYSNGNIGIDSQADYEQRKKDILNRTAGEACLTCKGTGKCHACNGTKVAHGFGNSYTCNLCNANGDCPTCNGTKVTPWNR